MDKKKLGSIILVFSICLLSSCAATRQTYQGAAAGGAVGAAAGALIDDNNRWRGGVIGGVLGASLGAAITEISAQATLEAAQTGRPATYRSDDGWQRVEAVPVSYDARTECRKVRERVWQNGQLVKDRVKEVCRGNKTQYIY